MRNLNSKSHIPPSTLHSFTKNDRKYPQSKSIHIDNSASQMVSQSSQQNTIKNQKPQIQNQTPHHHNTKFSILPTNPLNKYAYNFSRRGPSLVFDHSTQNSYIDDTCLWFRSLPKLHSDKKRYLRFDALEYVMTNCSEYDYPMIMYVCMQNMAGYFDQTNKLTNRVAALVLQQISAQVEQSNLMSYQLRYSLKRQVTWQIPSSITQIKLLVCAQNDQTDLILPLTSPMTMQFEISQI